VTLENPTRGLAVVFGIRPPRALTAAFIDNALRVSEGIAGLSDERTACAGSDFTCTRLKKPVRVRIAAILSAAPREERERPLRQSR
jgi:hypothetical protein